MAQGFNILPPGFGPVMAAVFYVDPDEEADGAVDGHREWTPY